MKTLIALLRGVNAGGAGGKILPMDALTRLMSGLGYAHTQVDLDNGALLFEAEGGEPLEHADAIAVAVERDLGPRVGVLVVTPEDLRQVVAGDPLQNEAGIDDQSLHVLFLFTAESDFGPSSVAAWSDAYRAVFGRLELPATNGERAVFGGTPEISTPVVYLYLPHGSESTKLTGAFFERNLGTAATARDWRTVLALAERAEAGAEEPPAAA